MFKKVSKGFTLIELLIVIAIIGILAVAFLPSVLGAPAKGRDAARIADVQKIQNALLNYNLEGNAYPNHTDEFDYIKSDGNFGRKTWVEVFGKDFGGKLPVDPSKDAAGDDQYYKYLSPASSYSFGIYTTMETLEASNTTCEGIQNGTIIPPVSDTVKADWCYGVLVE